jgi:WD40-like Beta Propeller Repeat
MHANGSHQRQITSAAPGHADARPTWSPNGRYLAFVKTARHKKFGYLTRYDTVSHHFVTFSIPDNSGQPTIQQVQVTARPAAVAWNRARNAADKPGFFILFEGTGHPFCMAHFYCLDALGMGRQAQHRNGFPSAADQTHMPTRLLDPDWFPVDPAFGSDALTTVEICASGHCAHSGIRLQIGQPTILPGAYQAVYSPTGGHVAFVRDASGMPQIYLTVNDPAGAQRDARLLTAGTQPDWQPLAAVPPT